MRRILNMGCGADTYGTDFVDLYPGRPEIIKIDVDDEELPYASNSFDEVYSRNLFEHLKNPFFVLKEMRRVLKPGGKLVLVTDNAGYPFHHIDFRGKAPPAHQEHGYHGAGDMDRHFALYTKMHLENFMAELGMKNAKIHYEFPSYPTFKSWLLKTFCTAMAKTGIFKNIAYPLVIVEAEKD